MRWFVGLMVVLMLAGCCTERLTRETLLPGIAEGQTEIVVHWPAGVAVDDVDTVDVNGNTITIGTMKTKPAGE